MISIVIPCYNEENVLPLLHARLNAAAESWNTPFEVVVVDDGSSDGSWDFLRRLHESDDRWRAVRFGRNFGHQTAVSAGILHARGDAVIVIDADLQDPPEELGRFIEKWREGYHVVYAIRQKRKEGLAKRLAYGAFYRILARMASIPIPLDSGDFCLLDRTVVDMLNDMPERRRFVRGLRSWVGFRQIGIAYERDARAAGDVKYTIGKLIRLALDGMLSFSTAPLRLATYFGFIVSALAFIGVLFTFFQRIFVDWFTAVGFPFVPGYYTMVIMILFLGGVQLVSLGIIGEYVGRVYDEVKGRPPWTIQETLGVDPQNGFRTG